MIHCVFQHVQPRWDVAKALNMDYDKNKDLVDTVCSELPNREYPEDDPNPLHQVFRAQGIKEYYLQKTQMGKVEQNNMYSQGFTSSVGKNDKKNNCVEIIMNKEVGGGSSTTKSLDDLLKDKSGILTSSLTKLDKTLNYFKKIKAAVMASKNPSGHDY